MSSINKQRSQQNTHLLTLDCMLANAVLNTIPLAVDCQPCNLPTIFHLPVVLELFFITTTFCIVPATHLEKLSIHPKVRVQCKFQLGKNVDANNSSHHPIHLLVTGHVSCLHQCLCSMLCQFTHLVLMTMIQCHSNGLISHHFCVGIIAHWLFEFLSGMRRHQVAICFHTNMNKN